jgi:hypothetical protein
MDFGERKQQKHIIEAVLFDGVTCKYRMYDEK